MAHVSEHADYRARKRLGLPRRAIARAAAKARTAGIPRESWAGAIRAYLDRKFLNHPVPRDLRIHGGNVYIFDLSDGTFVTCFPLPSRLRMGS